MNNKIFNTPFELSLHVVLLLDIADEGLTLDRIVALDFITVYGKYFGVADTLLNGNNRFAFSELSAKRNIIKAAIKDLVVDGLIIATDDESGVLYSISETGKILSNSFELDYAVEYKECMRLVLKKYKRFNDIQLFNEIYMVSSKK